MMARLGLSGVAVAETAATWTRWEQRRRLFLAADERARRVARPLLVVLPRTEGWFNRSMRIYEYGARHGDIFTGHDAPILYADSLARGVPAIADDSAVLYVACVLEYVTDLRRSMDEILRMAGAVDDSVSVTAQPWTGAAAVDPAARWAGIADTHAVSMGPVTGIHKVAAAGVVLALTAMSLASKKRSVSPPPAPAPDRVPEMTLPHREPGGEQP